MSPQEFQFASRELHTLLNEPANLSSAADFADELAKIPPDLSGTYICGCPWVGRVIPHFCPVHDGAFPIFEIREPRS